MPHIKLEYTDNLVRSAELQGLFQSIHQVLATTGGINLENCKSRCQALSDFRIGDGDARHAFVHLDIRFVEGRDMELKQQLGEEIKKILVDFFCTAQNPSATQITVEIRDILLADYHKHPQGSFTTQ